jgi:SAM-dependent methyltransferase
MESLVSQPRIHGAFSCSVCLGDRFSYRKVLWDSLIDEWCLSPLEVSLIERQQGGYCVNCGSNFRSIALAGAICSHLGYDKGLQNLIRSKEVIGLKILEINEAGNLSRWLSQLPGHLLVKYPDVDMQSMPYQEGSFDLVVHSDTLEHISDPIGALRECWRVVKRGGALVYTVPLLPGRLTRSRAGLPPSFHGISTTDAPDFKVWTEYGADAYMHALSAGFSSCAITPFDFPSAFSLTALK